METQWYTTTELHMDGSGLVHMNESRVVHGNRPGHGKGGWYRKRLDYYMEKSIVEPPEEIRVPSIIAF